MKIKKGVKGSCVPTHLECCERSWVDITLPYAVFTSTSRVMARLGIPVCSLTSGKAQDTSTQ